jgi:hypothetical protein
LFRVQRRTLNNADAVHLGYADRELVVPAR